MAHGKVFEKLHIGWQAPGQGAVFAYNIIIRGGNDDRDYHILILNGYFRFYMRMRVIAFECKIGELKLENIFHLRIYFHHG